jgi:exodeoxyribonuclease VII small subunit
MTSENNSPKPARSRAATFEKSFAELEEVVRRLEAGQLTLSEATTLFETGMKLAKQCNELLAGAELKISRLKTQFAEQMNLVPDGDEDSDDLDDDGEENGG